MKLKLKIFKKYFLITVVIIVVSLVFMTTILGFIISNYLVSQRRAALNECCNSITEITESGRLQDEQFLDMIGYVAPIVTKTIDAEIVLADTTGIPFFCSCDFFSEYGSCEHYESKIPERIVKKTLESEEFYEVGNFDGNLKTTNYIYGRKLLSKNNEIYGIVYSMSESASIGYFFMSIIRMLLMASLVTVILMFFAVYYVSYRLTKPLTLMSEAARCMARGDFSRRIPVTADDEVGELAVAFNNMTDSLVKLEGTRRSFVANVSHELKTPMTTIGGFIDGIIDGTIPQEKEKEYLRIVSDEVKRLSRLVQSMLSLSKLESGEMKANMTHFDLSAQLIDIVIAQQQRIESKNIDICGLDVITPLTVYADRDLIHQVVYNLVDNAIKFTAENGRIFFNIYCDKTGTHFLVRNYGIGIEEKDLPHIFDRFYKSDRSRSAVKESTGLGLYIAKTIIDIHKGQITVRSNADEFAEFEFWLPYNQGG